MLKSKSLRVVGAGVVGLLAVFFLKKQGFDFGIVEKASAPGGLLGIRKMKHGLAEQAANDFLWWPEELSFPGALSSVAKIMNQRLMKDYPNRHLFGNYTGQISVRGMCQSAKTI